MNQVANRPTSTHTNPTPITQAHTQIHPATQPPTREHVQRPTHACPPMLPAARARAPAWTRSRSCCGARWRGRSAPPPAWRRSCCRWVDRVCGVAGRGFGTRSCCKWVGGQGVWCGFGMGAAVSAWVGRACGAVGLWYEALLQVGGYVRVCGVGLVCWYVNGKRSDQNSKTLASWYEAQSYMLFQAAVNTPAPALDLPAACPTQPPPNPAGGEGGAGRGGGCAGGAAGGGAAGGGGRRDGALQRRDGRP